MRLFPPATVLTKECTKDIVLECEGRKYPIKKGMTVVIPLYSTQHDSKYFEDPETFDPERFLDKSGHPAGFLPFGLGPRQCLGRLLGALASVTIPIDC